MRGVHEVGADERERDAEPMLGGKLHALLELLLKRRRVEAATVSRSTPYVRGRGRTIHRRIDASQHFSRDTYRDIIFYDHYFFFLYNDFHLGRKDT